jgi:hypothetical protein
MIEIEFFGNKRHLNVHRETVKATWALREKKPESGTWYAANHLKVTRSAIQPAPDWCTTYTMTADAYQWSNRDTTWISEVVNFFQPKNKNDQ